MPPPEPSSPTCPYSPCCTPSSHPSSSSDLPPAQPLLFKGRPYLHTPLCCSPVLDDERTLSLLASEASAYTAAHGLMTLRSLTPAHVPCTLLPSPFPRAAYEHLQRLAPLFNVLYDRVGRDVEWLSSALRETAAADPFIARLLGVAETVEREGGGQRWRLCINRSDYMMHAHGDGAFTPRQVEFNAISAGMAALSSRVADMHAFLVSRHVPQYAVMNDLPHNTALDDVTLAMALAVRRFRDVYAGDVREQKTAVLFVVQSAEWNVVDQQLLAFTLWQRHAIPVVRRSLTQLAAEARIDPRGHLLLDDAVIALTYFRSGYTPVDYPSDAEWDTLLRVERSLSIKCPAVGYHLAGTKKVQQLLTLPAALGRFLPPSDAASLASVFARIWSLSPTDEPSAVIAEALANPSAFVLKPQREGGGNNLYKEELARALRWPAEELASWVLMAVIDAPAATCAALRAGRVERFRGTNELGVFGVWLSDGVHEAELNAAAGYLLRTKSVGNHEGGISSGSGFLDSVVLV